MNAFSKPIEGVVRWEAEVEVPELVLEWSDSGEVCRERVALVFRPHRLPLPAHLPHHVRRRPKRSARSR